MTGVLGGETEEHTGTQQREGHVAAEAEIGLMLLQTWEHQGLPATTKS